PQVVAVVAERNESDVIRYAASLERASEHPLAAAVVRSAKERGLEILKAGEFRSLAGKGVTGTVEGHPVVVGSGGLLREMHIDISAVVDPPACVARDSQTDTCGALEW